MMTEIFLVAIGATIFLRKKPKRILRPIIAICIFLACIEFYLIANVATEYKYDAKIAVYEREMEEIAETKETYKDTMDQASYEMLLDCFKTIYLKKIEVEEQKADFKLMKWFLYFDIK